MIAGPYKKKPETPAVGLSLGDGRCIGPWGECAVSDAPPKARLYAYSEASHWNMVQDGKAMGLMRRSRFLQWDIDGHKIFELREKLSHLEPDEALDALFDWTEWITAMGGVPSSIAGSAWSLWRSVLPAPLIIASKTFPVPDGIPIGGRQDGRRGHYEYVAMWDIRSAYQSAMRDVLVAGAYHELPRRSAMRMTGFAAAQVTLPGFCWGPLPCIAGNGSRLVYPTIGTVDGIWDLSELRMIHDLFGCKIEIQQAWGGHSLRLPWRKWSEVMTTGRELGSAAATLAKMTSNSLWGSFASSGGGTWVTYEDDRMVKVKELPPRKPAAIPIAAHITANVRARVFDEALTIGEEVIAVHTDSLIAPAYYQPNGPIGDAIGEWKLESYAGNLHLLSPQMYRWKPHTWDESWQYVASGIPPEFAHTVFDDRAEVEKKIALQRVMLRGESHGSYNEDVNFYGTEE